ncbi:hypothetical protein BVY00_00955 [bacterium G20]|nr:hypothetical protein BVY00_00955 [bacterium G20]
MIQKIKNRLLILGTLLTLALPLAVPAVASADPPVPPTTSSIRGNLCQGANLSTTAVGTDSSCGTADVSTFQQTLTTIINIISILVGVAAVIMIIFGGFKYITSSGDAEKVKGAKNTILYGIIGLIIVALAQIIVKFVLNQSIKVTG